MKTEKKVKTLIESKIFNSAILATLFIYLFSSAYLSQNPLPPTYDPALHAEIAGPIISSQAYPTTWEPLAKNPYTYPPLFHWVSFLISQSGLEIFRVVIFLGIFLYAIFPISTYIFVSAVDKKFALLSAVSAALISNWIEVFAAGEYPQMLAMNLSLLFLYFLFKKKFLPAGIVLGLTFLSHPFVPIFLTGFLLIQFFINLKNSSKNRKDVLINFSKLAFTALIFSSLWIPKYFEIVDNAISQRWENVQHYQQAGFIGFESVRSIFFDANVHTRFGLAFSLLSFLGLLILLWKKEFFITSLFLFTLLFTVFHIPGTQLKFLDMLSIPIPALTAVGIFNIGKILRSINPAILIIFLFLVFMFYIPNPYTKNFSVQNCCKQHTFSVETIEAANWLRNNDENYSRIVFVSKVEDEIWFSVVSKKLALDPHITALEALTEDAKQQVEDRAKVVQGMRQNENVDEVLEKYSVKYIVSKENLANYSQIFSNKEIRIYTR